MIKLVGPSVDRSVAIALSGGPDSMAALDFFRRGGREVTALHFDHGTEHGSFARAFVEKYCVENNVRLIVGEANRERLPKESPEEYWRNIRYDFLDNINLDMKIITVHNLDDQVESWIFTSLHGDGRLIPYGRGENIIRPFIGTTKKELLDWCARKSVPYIVDPGNFDEKYMRSLIRQKIIPQALRVNPGLYKVIRKKILNSFDDSGNK